jgi:class 3 adenylate cyclase
MGRFRSSLRYKIGALMLLLSLGPFIVVGVIGFVTIAAQLNRFASRLQAAENALRSDVVGDNLKGAAVDTAVEIDSYLLERIAEVRRWSEETVILEAAHAGDAAVRQEGLVGLSPEAVRARLDGKLFVPISPSLSSPASSYLFRQTERSESAVVEIIVTGLSGVNVLVTRPVSRVSQSDEPWWRVALARGALGIGVEEVHLDLDSHAPVIGIALPLVDPESKELRGVIRGLFRLTDLHRRLSQKATSLNADIRVLTRSGQLIADTSTNHNPKIILSADQNLVRQNDAPAIRAITTQPGVEGADFMAAGGNIVGYAHTYGDAFYAPSGWRGFKGFDFGVLVSQPEKRALQVLSELIQTGVEFEQLPWLLGALLWMVTLFVAVVAILGAVFLSGRISRPLIALSEKAQQVQQGDLTAHVTVSSQDEIGVLGRAFNMMTAGLRERERERDIFGRVVTPEVRERLLSGQLRLGGETRHVSVLFSDIRGFSTIVERLTPHQAVTFLNEYLTEMSEAIHAWNGYINNFVGDGIMVVFGVPLDQPDKEWRVVAAALTMCEKLMMLNERRRARGEQPIHMGIGISTGEVVAGQIGSLDRLMYTVIGDAVNVASRLESLTKEYTRYPILINGLTAQALRTRTDVRLKSLGPIAVKGRTEPVDVYAVLEWRKGDGAMIRIARNG